MTKKKPAAPATLSLRAYARHRDVSLKAVQRAIETGRITPEPDGKINAEACDLAWDLNTDPSKVRKEHTPKVKRVRKHSEKFAEAKADREDYQAKLARLSYEKKAGHLVDGTSVERRAFQNARVVRDALLNIANRIAAELASETDPVKVGNILTIEITRSLDELAAPRLEDLREAADDDDE